MVGERDRGILARSLSVESMIVELSLVAWTVVLTEVYWDEGVAPVGYFRLIFWSTFGGGASGGRSASSWGTAGRSRSMPMARIDNRMRQLRFEHGEITQQELADRAGCTRRRSSCSRRDVMCRHSAWRS